MFRTHTDVAIPPVSVDNSSDVEKYCCDFCDDGWNSETDVDIHIRKVHMGDMWKRKRDQKLSLCSICMREMKSDKDIELHIKQTHLLSKETALRVERDIYSCNDCHQIFFNKKILTAHIVYYHVNRRNKAERHECPKCSKPIVRRTFWCHFATHNMQSVAVCPICLHKCKNRIDLVRHTRGHPYKYRCNICGFETKISQFFDQHVSSHQVTDEIEKKNTTSSLERYFMPPVKKIPTHLIPTMYALKGVLLPKGMGVCVLCRHICIGTTNMKRHIYLEHNPVGIKAKKNFVCSCGDMFDMLILLKQHILKWKGHHKALDPGEDRIEQPETSQNEMRTEEVDSIPYSSFEEETIIGEIVVLEESQTPATSSSTLSVLTRSTGEATSMDEDSELSLPDGEPTTIGEVTKLSLPSRVVISIDEVSELEMPGEATSIDQVVELVPQTVTVTSSGKVSQLSSKGEATSIEQVVKLTLSDSDGLNLIPVQENATSTSSLSQIELSSDRFESNLTHISNPVNMLNANSELSSVVEAKNNCVNVEPATSSGGQTGQTSEHNMTFSYDITVE